MRWKRPQGATFVWVPQVKDVRHGPTRCSAEVDVTRRVGRPNRHYINLTNGLEAVEILRDELGVPSSDLRFTRMQSSHSEAQAYEKILSELDHDICFAMALGSPCFVYDFASREKRRGVPRSLWYGLQFCRFAFTKYVLGDERLPTRLLLRGNNVVEYWKNHVCDHVVSKSVRKRLKYYREYAAAAGTQEIKLFGVYGKSTDLDGQKELYARMAVQQMSTSVSLKPSVNFETCSVDEWRIHLERAGLFLYDDTVPLEGLLRQQGHEPFPTYVQ
mmetsp:Transcript_8976/g.21244  ORF Transcript_8976/g.21244 Transcript_8976/m.21244 type:complete len:273 (+) Transcript_8976:2113-2931(+)